MSMLSMEWGGTKSCSIMISSMYVLLTCVRLTQVFKKLLQVSDPGQMIFTTGINIQTLCRPVQPVPLQWRETLPSPVVPEWNLVQTLYVCWFYRCTSLCVAIDLSWRILCQGRSKCSAPL